MRAKSYLRQNYITITPIIISIFALAMTIISYIKISNSDMDKIRIEKAIDFCGKINLDGTMVDLYNKMRESNLLSRAQDFESRKNIQQNEKRLIGNYLNFLELGANIAMAANFEDSAIAIDIFTNCSCDMFRNAKLYYLFSIDDKTRYPSLIKLTSDAGFWNKTDYCKNTWKK